MAGTGAILTLPIPGLKGGGNGATAAAGTMRGDHLPAENGVGPGAAYRRVYSTVTVFARLRG